MSSKGRTAGLDVHSFPLYPRRSLLWSGWSGILHGWMTAGLGWLMLRQSLIEATHYLSPSLGQPILVISKGGPLVFLDSYLPPQLIISHHWCSQGLSCPPKTHRMWGVVSPVHSFPDFSLESSVRWLYTNSHLLFYSLPFFQFHGQRGRFPLPLWLILSSVTFGYTVQLHLARPDFCVKRSYRNLEKSLPPLQSLIFPDFYPVNEDLLP